MTLKKRLNTLAAQLYRSMNHNTEPGFDFEKSTHPTERLMFDQACLAYEFFMGDSPDWRGEEDEEELAANRLASEEQAADGAQRFGRIGGLDD
jgi:hypothetical protein